MGRGSGLQSGFGFSFGFGFEVSGACRPWFDRAVDAAGLLVRVGMWGEGGGEGGVGGEGELSLTLGSSSGLLDEAMSQKGFESCARVLKRGRRRGSGEMALAGARKRLGLGPG